MSLFLGDFELDEERRQLLREGRPVPLEPKAYELLCLLVERRPRALSRAQIRDAVWGGVFISESTLNQAINTLRQALGDDAREPRYIRTAHGFGYAYCGEARDSTDRRPRVSEEVERAEERSPYPGLSSFGEEDADRFFGREAEVEALWGRLRDRRLLAVIGPSGAGKTSFVRAGVVASRPSGWGALVCTPGARPLRNLGQALAPELSTDAEALRKLVGLEEAETAFELLEQWRRPLGGALLVLDQFEELFTLNAPEIQVELTELLARVARDADLHVLLSLRDDFLIRCSDHAALAPVFTELTPMPLLSGDALRRAVVEPASREGYRFEDEALVEEILTAVEGARGALPLLAFAVSRLWEKRDRERMVLTRAAYEEMGGVAGALAQHAEGVLGRIGRTRQGLVREMFRNLVTAQGTRAVVEREELLSVFSEREPAREVLDTLIDARLLTSFEAVEPASSRGAPSETGDEESLTPTPGDRAVHRIEVVHESLLKAWPRLVMWQAQDEEGAVLRDQLKQAVHLWDEKGRPEELLWTGPAYQEFRVWRSRYTAGLSTVEEAFAGAMAALAGRRRRRRRLVAVTALLALALGLGTVTVFWAQAEAEARRAEAGKLLAIGVGQIDEFPTLALAYATKSLELADTEDGRLFALRALQRGPAAILAPAVMGAEANQLAFSPDGAWLAVGGWGKIRLYHRDGRPPTVFGDLPTAGWYPLSPAFSPTGDTLVTARGGDMRGWSIPDGHERWAVRLEQEEDWWFPRRQREALFTRARPVEEGDTSEWILRRWDAATGDFEPVGTAGGPGDVDPSGRFYAFSSGTRVYREDLEEWGTPRLLGEHLSEIRDLAVSPDGRSVAASDRSGAVWIWSTDVDSDGPLRRLQVEGTNLLRYGPHATRLATVGHEGMSTTVHLLDLSAPPGARPWELRRNDQHYLNDLAFEPSGRWIVSANFNDTAFWPLRPDEPRVLVNPDGAVNDLVFTPNGDWLVTASRGAVRVWPLSPAVVQEPRVLFRTPMALPGLALDPSSLRVAVTGDRGRVFVVPFEGGEAQELLGFSENNQLRALAFSPDGRRLAAAPFMGPREEKVVRVWDLETGESEAYGPIPGAGEGDDGGIGAVFFVASDRVLVSGPGDAVVDLGDGTIQVLHPGAAGPDRRLVSAGAVTRDARAVFGVRSRTSFREDMDTPEPVSDVVRYTLEGGIPAVVEGYGTTTWNMAIDPSGTKLATASADGTVRIGPASSGEPHVFLGHEGRVRAVKFSPDGRWLATAGADGTIRLWPVPDVSETPLHARPLDELLAALRRFTNLRVVSDPHSPGRYTTQVDPFPGWAEPPEW